ncbi:MAG: response regulator [Cyclobacteriaceae bacterium]
MNRVLVVFFIWSLNTSALAQSHERFYNITRRDGLSSGSVTSIVQDAKGLVWIGTKQGVNRYDGHDFVEYHTGNSQLRSNDISALIIDHTERLWIGTNGGGLYYLDHSSGQIASYDDEGLGSKIMTMRMGLDSSLWVLSDQGITNLSPVQSPTTRYLRPELSTVASAMNLSTDTRWIGTSTGILIEMDSNDSFLSYDLSSNWPGATIQTIHPTGNGEILIGTRQYGLLMLDQRLDSIYRHPLPAVDVRDIIQDKEGVIWIGTDGQGVFSIAKGEIANYMHLTSNANSLVSNAIHTCFEDLNGNLWFGSAWDGISMIDRQFKALSFIYSDFKGEVESGILNIYIEKNNLWFGTDGLGLSIQDKGRLSRDVTDIIPPTSYIQFIDKLDGRYWFGTFQSGLYVIEDKPNGGILHLTSRSGLSHDDVRDIEQLDDHRYLVATWGGGLNLYNDRSGRIRKMGVGTDMPIDVVVLERMSVDEILVGTFGQGLFSFNSSDLTLRPSLSNLKNVISIKKHKEGVWLGTWGQGLHFSTAPFAESQPVLDEELPGNANVISITGADQSTNIWIATSERIFKVSPDLEVQSLPLTSEEFHINAARIDDSGKVYFGSTDGVISFDPQDIDNSSVKDIEILGVDVLDQPLRALDKYVSGSDRLTLEYDRNFLTFRFATPLYPSARDETYEVQLMPSNADWIDVGEERSITYANLKPGGYTFKVRNSHSEIEERIQFVILNPWWKTWWAYTIVLVLFFSLLYSFRRYSVNLEMVKKRLEIETIKHEKESEINDIKQRFFVNVSHEIRTPLTLIIGEIEQLALKIGGDRAVANAINNVRNNGNHLIQLVNELLDFRKLDEKGMRLKVAEGNFVVFCREIFLSFSNKADAQSINYVIRCDQEELLLWYDRDQLEKVFYNLLSNAFKNTPAGGKIEFFIERQEAHVRATIKDIGLGIPNNEIEDVFKRFYQKENDLNSSRKGFGIGLSIVKDIINLHHGTISVESEEGHGSCFSIELRPGREHFEEQDLIDQFENSDALTGYEAIEALQVGEPSDKKRKEQIMIVEDNVDIRRFMRDVLSSTFEVTVAADGLEAYDLIQQSLPDLILSDVMMPGMDGITLTKNVKQNATTSHIPVILLTARTGAIFKKEGYETGADDYITKPFNSAVLISRIENILKSRKALTNQIRNKLAVRPEDLNLTTPDERFLKELVGVIQSNLDNSDLNAKLLASEMGMSHSVIYKKIKALTGLKLVEFIREYRLQQAADMLAKYKLSVAEACYKVGFSDKKYFSQIFKKKFGQLPSEYTLPSK